MTYFMALVSAAWGSVILSLFEVPIQWISILIADSVTLVGIMMLMRKLEDRKILDFDRKPP